MKTDVNARPLRILLLGTMEPPTGGTSVAMILMREELKRIPGVEALSINTAGIRGNPLIGIWRFFSVIHQLFRAVPRCDVVSAHMATSGLFLMGPMAALFAFLYRKPLIIRKFAGKDFLDYGWLRSRLSLWSVRRSDLALFETQNLERLYSKMGFRRVKWFANNRPMIRPELEAIPRQRCRRFLYLGQLRLGKGMPEIIAAAERFGPEIEVDIYGISGFDIPEGYFDGLKRVKYRGFAADAVTTLAQYDCLLLPTYLESEGYPGVVFEAYSVGIPLIITRWKALPEIVDETSGILIPPRNADALYEAMKRLVEDADLYQRLCEGVKAKRLEFDTATLTRKFVGWCRELVEERQSGRSDA